MTANINNLNTNDKLPAFIRREDDTETFAIAVWNAPRAVRTYVTLPDPTNPPNAKAARDVAEVCTMVGVGVPPRANETTLSSHCTWTPCTMGQWDGVVPRAR